MKKLLIWMSSLVHAGLACAQIHSTQQLHQQLNNGDMSCQSYIGQMIERIKRYDLDTSRGAALNAVVAINPNAFSQAQQLDQWQKQHGTLKGPLHCVPVAIKNNINSEEMPVASGSLAMLGSQPIHDAPLVKQLKQAGAIILVSAAMDEFASGIVGVSSLSGRVGNAYNPLKNAGGSSSGSAVAVASDFSLIGIGTDNSGSVRIPAGFNGLFGLRPTYQFGLNQGIFPRGYLDGTFGPITRNIDDMRRVMALFDPPSYISSLRPPKRIGLVTSINNTTINLAPYESFSKQLKAQGFELVPITINGYNNNRRKSLSGEVEAVNNYLTTFPSTRQNFKDICLSNRTRVFGSIQECLHFANTNPGMHSDETEQVKKIFDENRKLLEQEMDNYQLDAVISPINTDGMASYNTQNLYISNFALASNSGLPSIVIPFDYHSNGLPRSVELIGRAFSENRLMDIVQKWDLASGKHRLPKLTESNLDLSQWPIYQFNQFKTLIGWLGYQQFLYKRMGATISPQQMNGLIRKATEYRENPSLTAKLNPKPQDIQLPTNISSP